MREKILDSIKKIRQTGTSKRMLIFLVLYLACITLSIASELLFFNEILICGFIIGLLILSSQFHNTSE